MAWILIAISVSANILSNAMFKIAMSAFPAQVTYGSVFWFLFNPFLWLGGLSCVLLLGCYLLALREFGLANTYAVVTSLSLVGVTIVSAFAFREPMSIPGLIGVALVIGGILLIGTHASTPASDTTVAAATVREGIS